MRKIALRAYAKVNYALEVLGVRPDGYHEISTVLQSVSLADELEIEGARAGFALHLEPEGTDVGPLEGTTVHRAWSQLRNLAGDELPIRMTLRKRIPAGAGLGGGSADAAAALVGLNELFELGLSATELRKIGLEVGADVPFCVCGGTALGEGVGEILTPLPAPPPHTLVVAKPAAEAQTAEIYRIYDAQEPGEHRCSVPSVVGALRTGSVRTLAETIGNDLALVTEGLVPGVRELREALSLAGAIGAAMSGSGSAVYGMFGSEGDAWEAAEELRRNAAFVSVCAPVDRGVEIGS